VLLRPELGPGDAHLVTVAAALAATEACVRVAGVRPGIKWPNDLVVGDRKLAGLLTESVVSGGNLEALVVGMGLNVRWPRPMPGELAATATALNHEIPDPAGAAGGPDRDDVLAAWLEALGPLLGDVVTAAGRRALGERHRRACVTLGRTVRVERVASDDPDADGVVVEGTAVDLTEEGHLVVDDGRTRRVVAVGDVVHLRPA
jgi:BirA family biotin operon repressor/biotin-[acetyl-CoA-carboxylase] ligase